MSYTNSPLVSYTKISPFKSCPRDHKIDRITPHCIVGQLNVEDMGAWFSNPSAQSSCNYGIGKDGRVALIVEEKDRSWCSSSRENDNRAVTIECASDRTYPYAINDTVYEKLIELCMDICLRNGKNTLLWFGDKDKTLAYQPKENEMVLTVHRWFAAKECPGQYIYERLGKIANEVTSRLNGATPQPPEKEEYTPDEWIAMISPIAQDLARQNAVLPSVVIAQTALETGWGKTDLTRKYNILGMKADLINNTWKEWSTWDGKTYDKVTPEYRDGQLIYITDTFRVYKTFRECVADYEAFLLHVRNDKGLKYARLQGKTDPAEVIHIIRIGTGTDAKPEGYCTDPNYETKILKIIKDYNLTQYDTAMPGYEPEPSPEPPEEPDVDIWYRVQVGAYKYKASAERQVAYVKEVTQYANYNAYEYKLNKIQEGYDCFIERTDMYRVYCGSFRSKENAIVRQDILKDTYRIDCFVTPQD